MLNRKCFVDPSEVDAAAWIDRQMARVISTGTVFILSQVVMLLRASLDMYLRLNTVYKWKVQTNKQFFLFEILI